MSEFKRGDLVAPEPVKGFGRPPVGLVLEIAKQPDGKTHNVLWVDAEGCFESWHYENALTHYKGVKNEEEAQDG